MGWLKKIGKSLEKGAKSLLGISASDAADDANDMQRDALGLQKYIAETQLGWAKEDRAEDRQWLRDERTWVKENRDRQKNVFQPMEDKVVQEAWNFDTPQAYEQEAAKANAATQAQYSLAAQNLARLKPNQQGNAALRLALASAAAGSNAQTKARTDLRDTGWARKIDALSLGKGMQPNASTGMRAAQNGLGSAISGLNSVASNAGSMASNAGAQAAMGMYNAGDIAQGLYKFGKGEGWWGGNGGRGSSSYIGGGFEPNSMGLSLLSNGVQAVSGGLDAAAAMFL